MDTNALDTGIICIKVYEDVQSGAPESRSRAFSDIVTQCGGALICISLNALEDDCQLEKDNELYCIKQLQSTAWCKVYLSRSLCEYEE